MSRLKLAVVFSLAISIPYISFYPLASTISADSDFKWRRLNIPAEGSAGNWVLARGSDVKCLTRAVGGTLYAYANPTGTANRLFKSQDNGVTWSSTGDVTGNIVDIAAAPDDASFVYYATASNVYRSTDAGVTFTALPPGPGGAGAGNVEITDIDVAKSDTSRIIAVSTRDKDAGQWGGVYIIDDSQPFSWQNTNAGSYDAYAVSFSPDYYYDRQVVAVVNDGADTFVVVKSGVGGWGATTGNARLSRDNASPSSSLTVINSASITFPDGYSTDITRGESAFFVAVNTGTGGGDVYRINAAASPSPSTATDLNAGVTAGLRNLDISSLAASGKLPETALLAGSAQDNRICLSRDGGKNWTVGSKAPTGEAVTGVIVAADFMTTGRAYAATSGTESAFSTSRDFGLIWNEQSLIDTFVNTTGIADIAPSPGYAKDRTLFLLATGTKHHVFRSTDDGTSWERVMSSAMTGVNSIKMVRLSPAYGRERRVVYLSGTSGGNPVIWRSTDNGENWNCMSAPFALDVMAVVDDNTLIIGGFQTGNAYIAVSTNGGFFFGTRVACGAQTLKSIALSPNYDQDRTIIAGNSDGWCYFSQDGGASFRPLPPEAAIRPLSGSVSVAFDPGFARNQIVYAASSTLNSGIYRFTIGKSQVWEKLDNTLPADSTISQLAVSADGVLYASNGKADGGMERSVNPTNASGAAFETVIAGLPAGAKLSVLTISSRQVFAGDTAGGCLLTLGDILTGGIVLRSPPDKAQGVGMLVNHTVRGITLDWDSLPGADDYEWQLSPTTDFSSLPTGFSGGVEGSKAVLPALEPAATYHWRVRVSQPVSSPWSDTWLFTTSLGEAVTAPQIEYPTAAAGSIPRKPIFQWDAIIGAESYELVVATDAGLASPIISRTGDYAIPGTAWESNVMLDYGTTYYWKVRGVSAVSKSAWSNTGAFRTEEKPVSTPLTPPQTPSPVPQGKGDLIPAPVVPQPEIIREVMPPWSLYLIGALAICVIMLIIVLLIVVMKVYF